MITNGGDEPAVPDSRKHILFSSIFGETTKLRYITQEHSSEEDVYKNSPVDFRIPPDDVYYFRTSFVYYSVICA